MRALVVYESMYGNTHTAAECIADGLRPGGAVHVVPVGDATADSVAAADLLVVGGPTHIHGMSTKMSRTQAVTEQTLGAEADKGHPHEVDPDAEGPGLRDWFDELDLDRPILAAAFDTRMDAAPVLTGRASKGIARRLRRHGADVVVEPESFLVDEDTHLLAGEEERATAWGRALLDAVAEVPRPHLGVADRQVGGLDATVESGGRYAPPR